MAEWCTIESDPAVFTELIQKLGVKNLQFKELYSLDDAQTIERISPIHGLIFLFKWPKLKEKRECLSQYDSKLFFAKQVIQNACATQSILSLLMNLQGADIGEKLQEFKSFCLEFDPQTRGEAIGNCDFIRIHHNSFAEQHIITVNDKKKKKQKSDEVYHFISYIPFGGVVYELDGLEQGPIVLGKSGENWLSVASEAITKRFNTYESKQIRFNLLALCENIVERKSKELALYQPKILHLLKTLKPLEAADQISCLEARGVKSDQSIDISEDILFQLQSTKEMLTEEIRREKQERRRASLQNQRRKHNYMGFIVQMLKVLGRSGRLQQLISKGKQAKRNAHKAK